jgi:ammonia channel protein AmtB
MNNGARVTTAANPPVESKVPGSGPGHNAWMLTSTLLVLFMTLPGLALFYGGSSDLNILSIMASVWALPAVTILWWLCGITFAPADLVLSWIFLKFAFLKALTQPNRLQRMVRITFSCSVDVCHYFCPILRRLLKE